MNRYLFSVLLFLLPWWLSAQGIRAYRSDSEGEVPRVMWFTHDIIDTLPFEVYRSPIGEDEFLQIATVKRTWIKQDTTIFVVFDTTIVEPNIYRYYITVFNEADTLISELVFAHTMGYIAPPYLVNFTASSAKDRKAIVLNWKLNENRTVQSLSLFRSRSYDDGYELVTVLSGDATHYVDEVPRANEPWFYFLLIKDFFGYQMPGVRIHGFSNFAEVPFPPQDMTVSYHETGIKVKWRGIGDNIIGYNLYRKVDENPGFIRIISQYYAPGEWIEVTDTIVYPPETQSLAYFCTAVSDGFKASNAGDTVFLNLAVNIPVPPPGDLDYFRSDRGYPMLLWRSQEENNYVAGYNVYRIDLNREDLPVKLNRNLLLYTTNHFTDTTLQEEGRYRYEVESVSITGEESALRISVDIQYDPLNIVLLISSTQNKSGITLQWQPITSVEVKNLFLYRQQGDKQPVLLSKVANVKGKYLDNKTTGGTSYIYTVWAELKNGTKILVNEGHLVKRNPVN
ncbi:MAG: hypothetical protein RQ866_00905 [Bacteroidales bacterium]|nr:hypothetical protein [Bacteroidales bacterium]